MCVSTSAGDAYEVAVLAGSWTSRTAAGSVGSAGRRAHGVEARDECALGDDCLDVVEAHRAAVWQRDPARKTLSSSWQPGPRSAGLRFSAATSRPIRPSWAPNAAAGTPKFAGAVRIEAANSALCAKVFALVCDLVVQLNPLPCTTACR